MSRRLPELMGSAAALELVDGAKLVRAQHQDLACDTIYLAADVRELTSAGRIRRRRRMPEVMGAKEAAEYLGVLRPNLYKTIGKTPVPQQQTERGTVYLADGIRTLKERRAARPVSPPRVCRKHGDEDMRVGQNGRRHCAVCSRERKRALLSDSVRRAEYNRQRREKYQQQRGAEVAV